MTFAQTARREGFIASLSVRGRQVNLLPNGPVVWALVETATPEAGEWAVSNEERNAARLKILVDAFTPTQFAALTPTSIFQDVLTGATYRAYKSDSQPVDIAITFTVETSGPSA